MALLKDVNWVIKDEYFYREHHKFSGIYVLYLLDKEGVDRAIQNFCIKENALALALEDKKWKEIGPKITHSTLVTKELPKFDKVLEDCGPVNTLEIDLLIQKKKEERKKRRLARKVNKELRDGSKECKKTR